MFCDWGQLSDGIVARRSRYSMTHLRSGEPVGITCDIVLVEHIAIQLPQTKKPNLSVELFCGADNTAFDERITYPSEGKIS